MSVTLETIVLIAVAVACVGAIWLPHLRELDAEQGDEPDPAPAPEGDEQAQPALPPKPMRPLG